MACTAGSTSWVCWIAGQANVLNNIANTLVPVQKLIVGAGYLIGCAFIFKAIYSLKMYGEARTMQSSSTSIKEPLVFLIIGALLIYSQTAFEIMMQTSFGYQNILEYAPVNSGSDAFNTLFGSGSLVGRPLSIIIRVVGYIAFIRGWVLIARSASQGQPPGGTGKGLMHVFGGILAINIVGTLNMINNTLYGT